MTQEDKELLFKSLNEGLYFNVVVQNVRPGMEHIKGRLLTMSFYQPVSVYVLTDPASGEQEFSPAEDIKPYLRPMSSMTEEERNEYLDVKMQECERVALAEVYRPEAISIVLDWLNAHNFDYRGLIPKGLAIEAPEGMYA